MAKTWYPVIDYQICAECGICVVHCAHDVYDKTKEPSPIVLNHENCIDHCHGCGNRCPVGAITYVGDDTDWMPPMNKEKIKDTGYFQGCDKLSYKKILVEYLYLDLHTCDRCIGTDQVLDDVMMILTPAFHLAGYQVVYNKIEMKTAEIAEKYRFISSPTIRVNGNDICQSVSENSCGCCSEISGTTVDCRVFEHNGEYYEVPPKEMIADAIMKAVYEQRTEEFSCRDFELPDNLIQFYQGKINKNCSCEECC